MSFPRPSVPAIDAASFETPSIRSPSEQMTYVRWSTISSYGRLKSSARNPSAMPKPTPFANPCPSGPVVASMPAVWCTSGCPGVIASNLRKELAGALLFDGVSFSVERRDRVALSGPNGAGKTTLLRILAGQTEKHGGELAFEKGTRVALHDQRPPLDQNLTVREYVLSGARDLVALERELGELEQAMAAGTHDQATLNRYAEAQARLEHAGGYGWRDRATSVLRGLGFADGDLDRQLRTFSGGELTRASLARALGGDPDLLLLDEPTNHLDVASLEWLERELQSLDAAVIPRAQRAHRRRRQRGRAEDRRARAPARCDLCARAGRARRARRSERLGEDDAARGDRERARHSHRPRRAGWILLAAGDGARYARVRAAVRADDDGPLAARCSVAAGALPVLRLDGAREGGHRSVWRRATPTRAGGDGRVGRELPRARRADEPSRPRQPRSARSGARRVSRNGAARLARPCA